LLLFLFIYAIIDAIHFPIILICCQLFFLLNDICCQP